MTSSLPLPSFLSCFFVLCSEATYMCVLFLPSFLFSRILFMYFPASFFLSFLLLLLRSLQGSEMCVVFLSLLSYSLCLPPLLSSFLISRILFVFFPVSFFLPFSSSVLCSEARCVFCFFLSVLSYSLGLLPCLLLPVFLLLRYLFAVK